MQVGGADSNLSAVSVQAVQSRVQNCQQQATTIHRSSGTWRSDAHDQELEEEEELCVEEEEMEEGEEQEQEEEDEKSQVVLPRLTLAHPGSTPTCTPLGTTYLQLGCSLCVSECLCVWWCVYHDNAWPLLLITAWGATYITLLRRRRAVIEERSQLQQSLVKLFLQEIEAQSEPAFR
eukprot:COSAG05_NODE_160_length_15590_cov_14.460848_5_plen_177_part_00